MRPPFPWFLLAPLLWTGAAQADLVWEKTSLEVPSPPPGELTRVAIPFQNLGSTPIQIESVTPSCRCLHVELSHRSIAPGSSGTLTATLRTIGTQTTRTARIEVVTSDAPARPQTLTIQIVPKPSISLEPAILWWRTGSACSEKMAEIELPPDATLNILPLSANTPFRYRLEKIPFTNRYHLTVTPNTTQYPTQSQLALAVSLKNAPPPEPRALHVRILE